LLAVCCNSSTVPPLCTTGGGFVEKTDKFALMKLDIAVQSLNYLLIMIIFVNNISLQRFAQEKESVSVASSK
jgi:hypothetical protein